jgi:hypothetical protein
MVDLSPGIGLMTSADRLRLEAVVSVAAHPHQALVLGLLDWRCALEVVRVRARIPAHGFGPTKVPRTACRNTDFRHSFACRAADVALTAATGQV